MELTVLHLADNLEISLDPESNILCCKWLGYQTEDVLKTSGEIILKLFKQHKCSKMLNDNTHVKGPWDHSADWTSREWFPLMIEAGLNHFAWVCSKDLFSQLSAKRALPEKGIVRIFHSCEEAENWLISMK